MRGLGLQSAGVLLSWVAFAEGNSSADAVYTVEFGISGCPKYADPCRKMVEGVKLENATAGLVESFIELIEECALNNQFAFNDKDCYWKAEGSMVTEGTMQCSTSTDAVGQSVQYYLPSALKSKFTKVDFSRALDCISTQKNIQVETLSTCSAETVVAVEGKVADKGRTVTIKKTDKAIPNGIRIGACPSTVFSGPSTVFSDPVKVTAHFKKATKPLIAGALAPVLAITALAYR